VIPLLRGLAQLAVLALAIAAAPAGASLSVVDDDGATVTLPRPATRIVSLAPHLTEQLFAVGAGALVVGTTDYADYPPAALRIARVGRAHSVDLEKLAALKPDLIVVWGSGFPPALIESIRRLAVPLFVSEPRSLDDVARTLVRLGTLTGHDGTVAAAAFTDRVAALRARYAERSAVRVFYQVWAAPLMTLSGKHVVSEAIRVCGGRNVFADLAPIAPQVSVEAVIAADPQLIVTAEPAGRPSGALGAWQRFPNLAATRLNRFVTLDADRINRHGPRLPDEIEVLCAAIDETRLRALK
jgi:iron complex transport system substrate-binding protein